MTSLPVHSEDLQLPASLTRTYTSKVHGGDILRGLNALRAEDSLCDVTLTAERRSFPVHRVVMAALTDYFRAMFTGPLRESRENCIELLGVTAVGLHHVIEYAYTAQVRITPDNILDVLEAANHLQVKSLIDVCCNYLREGLELKNHRAVLAIADACGLTHLRVSVESHIVKNFRLFTEEPEFMELDYMKLCSFLARDDLEGCWELSLFDVAAQWLLNKPERLQYARQVMACIRFPLIREDLLKEVVESQYDFMKRNPTCEPLLEEARQYHSNVLMQPALQTARTRIRNTKEHMLVVGGEGDLGVMDSVFEVVMEARVNRWDRPTLPKAMAYHRVASLDNFAYVVGGQNAVNHPVDLGRSGISDVFRFDPRRNDWTQVTSLTELRTDFALVEAQGCLYAIGGRNQTENCLSSVERYDPKQNLWSRVADLPEALHGHAGCKLGGNIYISGGFSLQLMMRISTVYRYDIDGNSWHEESGMVTRRAWHNMAAVGNKMFVLGGNEKNANGEEIDLKLVECYNPSTRQWTVMANMPVPQSESSCLVLDEKIYVLGGYRWDTQQFLSVISQFDPAKNEWCICNHGLPEPLSGVGCCTMVFEKRWWQENQENSD
ncbi:PREDICTED: kelch-like protein 13 [Branchiostoma belcheri]|uniref:Kelch-like protein 13 n=1 Tax=Branchiostoma belcheri TaxID=7741 RepID=A0A6P4ZZV9_BRABE|nr:PREDICTED: kelch-like protein 13 [Branchiostoma belcheri]